MSSRSSAWPVSALYGFFGKRFLRNIYFSRVKVPSVFLLDVLNDLFFFFVREMSNDKIWFSLQKALEI